jgi:hypothetical protein
MVEQIENFTTLFKELKFYKYEENIKKIKEIKYKIDSLFEKFGSNKKDLKIIDWKYDHMPNRSNEEEYLNIKIKKNNKSFLFHISIGELDNLLTLKNSKKFWDLIDKKIKEDKNSDSFVKEIENMFGNFYNLENGFGNLIDSTDSKKIEETHNRVDKTLKKIANDLKIKINGYSIKDGRIDWIKDGNDHKIDLSIINNKDLKNLQELAGNFNF